MKSEDLQITGGLIVSQVVCHWKWNRMKNKKRFEKVLQGEDETSPSHIHSKSTTEVDLSKQWNC